jgi:hypothetical protein
MASLKILSPYMFCAPEEYQRISEEDFYDPPKRRSIYSGLHGITTQKMELFANTSLRTSNSTILE